MAAATLVFWLPVSSISPTFEPTIDAAVVPVVAPPDV
jgi:hypothetical protein